MTTTPTPDPRIESHLLPPGTNVPNNDRLPLVIYRGALSGASDAASGFEELFDRNGWGGSWRDGIYSYHHFHTTAHEALGIAAGTARVCFGGPDGVVAEVAAGDMVVIPAGVGHKNLGASSDFLVIGSYPDGQEPDMNRDDRPVKPALLDKVRAVPLPGTDPLFGPTGPLLRHWGG